MKHRLFAALSLSLAVLSVPLDGLAQPAAPAKEYEPQVGQAGKDVIWVPTPDALVTMMLKAAKVVPSDLVYDLGAGDGKIAIAAAKEFGATAVGIEYDPKMAEHARGNVRKAGVDGKVKIITGDIFVEDFSKATVLTLYLLPELNLKLRPTILGMKPGTRVVAHQFHMGDWDPDETMKLEYRDAYLWIVPAKVEGTWKLKETRGSIEATVSLAQVFQRIGGTATVGGKSQPLVGAEIRGNEVQFTFAIADGRYYRAKGTVDGDTITGEMTWIGNVTPFTARRSM
jgi:SAM-dependent methyltransferase